MAVATYRDLSMDASDSELLGSWWADRLGLEWDRNRPHVGRTAGPTPQHTIWFDEVAERKTVKHRVHLDIYARSLDELLDAGATVLEPQRDGWSWTVMADPEGGEFCAFVRDEVPAEPLHGIVIDSVDPAAIATWWAQAFGVEVVHHEEHAYSTVENVPGMPSFTMDFVPVPEPKVIKNRVHWDVVAPDVGLLVAAGATVLRHPDDDIRWTVLADPEGNEFCAFPD